MHKNNLYWCGAKSFCSTDSIVSSLFWKFCSLFSI